VQLPFDPRAVGEAVTRGIPFVISQPESDVTRAMIELVSIVAPEQTGALVGAGAGGDKKRKRGIFGR
jgi:MinD-like ATPase involved in chromosome partitioning or flagellar assembly